MPVVTSKKMSSTPSRIMPPARPKMPDTREDAKTAAPIMLNAARLIPRRASSRPRQRAVDHVDRVLQPVDGHERAEARALLLPEQHLVEHVEPVERDAGLAILGLDLAGLVEERLAPPDLVDDLLDLFRRRIGRQLR